MDHPRSKLPAVLAVLFCIALLGGVGVLLWKTLPEKQQPQQAETIQTDSVFSSEQTAVEPEREAPYEGELPEQAEAAQPEQPDSEQPSEPAADPAAPDDAQRALGYVTRRDVRAALTKGGKCADVMRTFTTTAAFDEHLRIVLSRMYQHNTSWLPVRNIISQLTR